YTFEESDTDMLFQLFSMYENEAKRTMEKKLVFPAYDYVLKCSHTFNLLDARGVISVTERTGYISRVRHLAREIDKIYVEQRKKLGFPMLKKEENKHVERRIIRNRPGRTACSIYSRCRKAIKRKNSSLFKGRTHNF